MQKKDGKTVYNSLVMAGGTFTFSGQWKRNTLGTEIMIYVDGKLNTKIHTSCSQPIGPGLISGDFEVISGESRNGGKLCPLKLDGGYHQSDSDSDDSKSWFSWSK